METTNVRVYPSVYLEALYWVAVARPIFDEETGRGVDCPFHDCPVVKEVHIADGGEPGETEHENPNVVLVAARTIGANTYFGLVKNKTKNVASSVYESTVTPLFVEILVYIEGHEGPHYARDAAVNEREVIAKTTTCDYDCITPESCKVPP